MTTNNFIIAEDRVDPLKIPQKVLHTGARMPCIGLGTFGSDRYSGIEVANVERSGVHPAVVCLKWAVQRGQVPIPFSTKRINYLSNLRGIISDPLLAEEMSAIEGIDKNCRLIKGQVFLWEGAKDWTDLWDEDGEIKGPED